MKRGNLFWAAALGGGLYWASKQPGGIKGTFDRVSGKLQEIQNSPDPLGSIKRQIQDARFNSARNVEPMNDMNTYQPTTGYNAPAPMAANAYPETRSTTGLL